jgi:GH25 family lysozyme M1 (1,4-beta-N-acetylmuramidase)
MAFKMTGIDISSYQGNPDFRQVKAAGWDFVLHKVTEGHTFKDPRAAQNIPAAKAAGLHVGVYHFMRARDEATAAQEADFFIATLKPFLPLDMPVALDVEGYSFSSAFTRDTLRKCAMVIINKLLAANFYVVLYCNKDYAVNVFDIKQRPRDYGRVGIWYAYPNGNAGLVDDTGPLGREAGIIQYFWKGKIPGIVGDVDLDASRYDYPGIIKAQGQNGYTKPPVIKSDTSGVLKMAKNGVYQLKTNGPEGVKVVSGNSADAIVIPRKHREGDADYWFIVAVGDVGSECGIYVSGPGVDSFRAFIVRVVGK